jgi:hypothetical protein
LDGGRYCPSQTIPEGIIYFYYRLILRGSKGGLFFMEHNKKIEQLKRTGEQKIEIAKIKNELRLNSLKAEKEQLKINEDIRELKTIVKQDKTIINAGMILNMWGTLGTIISTLLTISGLWIYFNTSYLKSICLILSITMIQFTVFILAKQDTNIKKHFNQHAFKVSVLKIVLLSISIYGNYNFFTTGRDINILEKIIIFFLCLAIDYISIYCISISQDFKTLNRNISNDSLYTGLLGKIFYNITCKFINSIESKYKENKNTFNPVNDRDFKLIECKNDITDNKELDSPVNDRDLNELLKAIFENSNGQICPSVLFLTEKTNLTRTKINQLKKILVDLNILNTEGNKTILNLDKEQSFELIKKYGGVGNG